MKEGHQDWIILFTKSTQKISNSSLVLVPLANLIQYIYITSYEMAIKKREKYIVHYSARLLSVGLSFTVHPAPKKIKNHLKPTKNRDSTKEWQISLPLIKATLEALSKHKIF